MDELSLEFEIELGTNDPKIPQMNIATLDNFINMIFKSEEFIK